MRVSQMCLILVLSVDEFEACKMDYFTEVTFESVVTEYSLFCQKGHLKEIMQSVTLFVSSIVSSIFIMLQDRYGSKNILIWTFFGVALPGFVCVVFIDGSVSKILGISCLWTFMDIIAILASILKNELLVQPYRGHSNVLSRISLCVGSLLTVFLTLHLRHYKYMVTLFFVGYLAYMPLMIWGLPHSPSYLLKQKKYAELKNAVVKIARINDYPDQKLQSTLCSIDNIIDCESRF